MLTCLTLRVRLDRAKQKRPVAPFMPTKEYRPGGYPTAPGPGTPDPSSWEDILELSDSEAKKKMDRNSIKDAITSQDQDMDVHQIATWTDVLIGLVHKGCR